MKSERYFECDRAKVFWEVKQHIRRAFLSDWGSVFCSADIKTGRVIPVSPLLVEESGFKNHIVLSSSMHEKYIKPYVGQERAEADFLTDMLWILRFKTTGCNCSSMEFKAGFRKSNGNQADIPLRAVIGPCDRIEVGPCLKIMLPWED